MKSLFKKSIQLKNTILFLFMLALVCGCGNSVYVVNDKYKINPDEQKKLFVYPTPQKGLQVNSDNLLLEGEDNIKPAIRKIMQKKLHKMQLTVTKDFVNKIEIENGTVDYELSDQFKLIDNHIVYENIDNEELPDQFIFPTKNFLRHVGVSSDIIVLFTKFEAATAKEMDYFFETIPTPGVTGTFTTSIGSNSNNSLRTNIEYIIWDYDKNQVVKIGMSEVKTSVSEGGLSKTAWMNHMRDIILEVFIGTPFVDYNMYDLFL